MNSRVSFWGFFAVAFVSWMLFPFPSAIACGWWGDGEASSGADDAVVIGADGKPIGQSEKFKGMKLPGEMGYGIAISAPDKAVPYLRATFGQPVNRIDELKDFGFHAVIDLATPEKTAKLHRAETEALGMGYFNLPIDGDIPEQRQVDLYSEIILKAGNRPLLVYAPKASLLGLMWTSYRLDQGVPAEFAIQEGRAFGLTGEQEKKLHIQ